MKSIKIVLITVDLKVIKLTYCLVENLLFTPLNDRQRRSAPEIDNGGRCITEQTQQTSTTEETTQQTTEQTSPRTEQVCEEVCETVCSIRTPQPFTP